MDNSSKKLWLAICLPVLFIIASLVYPEMLPGGGKGKPQFAPNDDMELLRPFVKEMLPGSGESKPQFAPNDEMESLRPFVDEFWSDILGTSYSTSFVSNGSLLSSWEHYLSGGRDELIKKVKDKYRVDISEYYYEPIPVVLTHIKDRSANSRNQPGPRPSGR